MWGYVRGHDLHIVPQINSGAAICLGMANRVLRRRPTFNFNIDPKKVAWNLRQLRIGMETAGITRGSWRPRKARLGIRVKANQP